MSVSVAFWLVLMILFLIAESESVAIVSLWFAVGSLVSILVSLLGFSFRVQVIVFLIVSIISLASLRPFVRKFLLPKNSHTNLDLVIGSVGLITVPVDNITAQGQVKLGTMYWSARSTSGEPIPDGTLVQVDRIEGVKVFVSIVNKPV